MRLAVIGTFYRRHENNIPLLKRLYVEASKAPDEAWLVCETPKDAEALYGAYNALYEAEMLYRWPEGLQIITLPTPRDRGKYAVIPYSNKINWALDRQRADAIVYLDNGSMPGEHKYRDMIAAMEENCWSAVYCTQHRTGFIDERSVAQDAVADGYCRLNYTQVMHRPTKDRWPMDLQYATPNDLADATFWRKLHRTLGDFYPVGPQILDEHHIPSPSAQGLE